MGDYIKRMDALICLPQYPLNYNKEQADAFLNGYYQMWKNVENCAAADVVERKHGHGRLIDADALQLKLLTAEPGKVYDFCYPCKEVLQAIKDSPTIIERETN